MHGCSTRWQLGNPEKLCEDFLAWLRETAMTIMPANYGQPKKNNRFLILIALGIIFVVAAVALILSVGSWNIPSEAKKMKNPVPPTDEAVNDGMFNYMKHCQSCHGSDGDG